MHLSLDVDVQKLKTEKLKKEKRKTEDDRDSLKTKYKKLHLSMKDAGLGRTSEKWQREIPEEKAKADHWEKKFQEMQMQNEALERSLAESQKEKCGLKARMAELGRSLHHHLSRDSAIELTSSLKKIEEMKGKIEELESALHNCELRIELLEVREGRWEEELHHSHDQVRNRDYLMGEAIIQIREVADHLQTLAVQADTLSMNLVPDLVLPHKFKMPEFEKYNGTSCPQAHITMFCRRLTGYVNNDQLLIHCFQDSLVRAASKWYNQLSRARISSWIDLAQAFMKQYNHIKDMMPDRITLQNMEKKSNESFSTTKSFADIVMAGEMIENAIRGGKIEAGEITKRSALRKKDNEVVERLIKMGIVKFDDTPSAENPLPNHGHKGINAIGENVVRKIILRSLMDNKELEFYEEGSEGGNIYATEGELTKKKVNYPRIIISRPRNTKGGTQVVPKVIIHKPVSFSYKDNKMIPWNYDCNVTIPGGEILASNSKEVQSEGSYTRTGRRYDSRNIRTEPVKSKTLVIERDKGAEALINEPVKGEEVKEFLKFLKHSEYNVVEKLRKQPARISVLALLLSSEVHREALMKVLNDTYVTKDISVNKLDRLVSNISADNFIYFSDDEIPPRGMGLTKALHITTRCKGYTPPSVLIDNGSALNVLPLSTLKRLRIDRVVPSSLHQKLNLVIEGRLVTINAEEDIIATVTNDASYLEANEEAIECSFRSLEFVNATFILEGNEVLVPKISKTTRMGMQMMMGKRALPGKGLGRHFQGEIQVPMLKEKRDHFGLGFRPDARQKKREIEKKQERRRARLNGEEVKWESMTFPHISQTFVSGGIIHPERGLLENENLHINAIHEEETGQRKLLGICPYEPGSILNNWTTGELPVVFRDYTESLDINDMSNDTRDSEVHFEQDMCLEEFQDFEGDRDCDLSLDLLRMVKQEEKQILPHEEVVENIVLKEGKVVKIGTCIPEETKRDLVELLWEFKDVFAWSYQDMPGLSTDIVVHRLPIRVECKPVQQKLRRMRPDVVLKIKEEVKKQFDAGFLQMVKYSERVANIVPIPKKDGKVWMCVDYRDLNKASPKDNFPLPHIDTLVDNTVGYSLVVDDMIAKSRTEKEHIEVLKKLFLRLRKFQLKLNPAKRTFGAWSGKLLGFIVSERGIEVDSNKKHNQGVWDDECQKAFDKVKQYLSNAPVLSPPNPDRPLILYLSVFNNSMGCVLGQHDESGRKEKAIYYLKLMYVATTEECPWKLNFDGASNAVGNGIGAILVSLSGDHHPFTCKLDFDCTNNMTEYEACIMGIRAAVERKIRVLEVYGDSALVIYQLKGEWETRDPKLIDYRKIVLGLIVTS
ncbi:hypothetical protein EPI10_002310 [Gossypium australe]|uniref:Uncharacterized protein n=1 Tax=Gossypium australe TaxID=47621 RepID=A0A5B6VDK2_9ROSI|nr:hypothetical protein EPI10_002310 [Gossypium australe]